MKRKFPLAAADADFIRSAPPVITHRIESEATCESMWQTLTSDGALASWAHGITGADWTSARPFGIGTTRTVRAGALAALNERFFRWDEGNRMSFYVESASLPGFKRFAEDLVLEPASIGSRLTWTFAVQAQPWFAPTLSLSRPILERVTRGWADGAVRLTLEAISR
ncbi:SRPBCC family protein [Rhodococcus erythropolis]|uniref:SRPBCC family protein n=1 Tax=Rhodococcus erythropolis TaxID=1833 RepID=UPI001BE7476F|nr:SRPBCC family protein [Rhodococcus erythropolis]MBT2265634.1 SRPBCC family protein [Rhodococcus erythropolis]